MNNNLKKKKDMIKKFIVCMVKGFCYTTATIIGMLALLYFIDCCDQQHAQLENQYNQEAIQNQRGL
jgi:hypothetical protein